MPSHVINPASDTCKKHLGNTCINYLISAMGLGGLKPLILRTRGQHVFDGLASKNVWILAMSVVACSETRGVIQTHVIYLVCIDLQFTQH